MTTLERRYEKGQAVLALMAGTDTGHSPMPGIDQLAPDLRRIIDEALYGSIWTRPYLSISVNGSGGIASTEASHRTLSEHGHGSRTGSRGVHSANLLCWSPGHRSTDDENCHAFAIAAKCSSHLGFGLGSVDISLLRIIPGRLRRRILDLSLRFKAISAFLHLE